MKKSTHLALNSYLLKVPHGVDDRPELALFVPIKEFVDGFRPQFGFVRWVAEVVEEHAFIVS